MNADQNLEIVLQYIKYNIICFIYPFSLMKILLMVSKSYYAHMVGTTEEVAKNNERPNFAKLTVM